MNEEDIKNIVHRTLQDQRERANDDFDEVVLKTISAILTSFGINGDEKAEIRADFMHLRRWRKASEQVSRISWVAVVGTILTGFCGMIWLGFKTVMGK